MPLLTILNIHIKVFLPIAILSIEIITQKWPYSLETSIFAKFLANQSLSLENLAIEQLK